MATPKHITNYHELFFVAARSAVLMGVLRLTFPNADSAGRFRRRLYAFREAVYSSPAHCPDLALQLPLMSFNLDGSCVELTMHKELE